jgi:serine/threonine-protein kinase
MRGTGAIVRGACAAALVVGLTLAATARAQAPGAGNDKVAAEALFEDGRRLVTAGNYAEACPKFADSQRLDPSPGTLLNLASCYEKSGRSATAWATYKEAASAANAAGRSDYVATAQRHAEALSPKLAHLTMLVPTPVDGLQITRDGVRIDRAEWGLAIPIDAGKHAIEASAPGHKSWSSSVDVAQDGAQASVTVPALEALPAEALPPPVQPPPTVTAPVSPPPPSEGDASTGSGQRAAGLILGGAGVVGLGLGTAFAVIAKNKYNDSLANCHTDDPNVCNSTGLSARNDARSAGDVASVAVGVGAAALVGGAVIWLTAPRAGSPPSTGSARVGIAPTLGGAVVQGAW